MIDAILQITLNNVCISLVLAITAVIIGITLKRPAITYMMWLLVFIKLLTPPLMMIPAIHISLMGEDTAELNIVNNDELQNVQDSEISGNQGYVNFISKIKALDLVNCKYWFFITWLLGSISVLAWSLCQVYRFHRLFIKESEAGSPEIQSFARRIAYSFGLKTVPGIHTTSAKVSPMVWWIGGKVWVIMPSALIQQMDTHRLQWILSHELAHVRRRDYIVRWIEWLACVCFWWNPVTWWARYNLRANEELCCDALVLSSLKPKPYDYGDSLLKAIEFLAFPACRQPAIASGINGGKLLKRRVKMIVSKNQNRSKLRWLQACILLGALVLLPFGLTIAQDSTGNERQNAESTPAIVDRAPASEEQLHKMKATIHEINEALKAGEISKEEADSRLADLELKSVQSRKTQIKKMESSFSQVKKALAAREISLEEANKKLADLKKELAAKRNVILAKSFLWTGVSDRTKGRVNDLPYQGINYGDVLKAAVDEGIVSKEYVEKKLVELEDSQYDKFVQKLEGAVKAGKITQEEADARSKARMEYIEAMRKKRQLRSLSSK